MEQKKKITDLGPNDPIIIVWMQGGEFKVENRYANKDWKMISKALNAVTGITHLHRFVDIESANMYIENRKKAFLQGKS